MVSHTNRKARRAPRYRRGLFALSTVAIMVAGITVTTLDQPLPAVTALPGATAEPAPTGPTGPGDGSGGTGGGGQFQPPGWPEAGPGYSGGNVPAPPQGNGIDINNPTAAPNYDQAPQNPQSGPTGQQPVHGTQPPNYDLPPPEQAPTQQAPQQEPQGPAQQRATQPSSAPNNSQDQALHDLQKHCEDIAQQLGITDPVMVLPANLPSGSVLSGPGRDVTGGIGACGICPPQQGPQPFPEKPGPRPRPTIQPRPIEDPNFDQTTDTAEESPFPEDYCTPERNGGTSSCRGPVGVCFKQGMNDPSPEIREERADYIWYANELRRANGGTLTKRKTGDLASRKARESRDERKNNPGPYAGGTKAVGHMPDLLWGTANEGLDRSREINPMDKSLNSSIGWQGSQYPIGYEATEFYEGVWTYSATGAGQCMAITG